MRYYGVENTIDCVKYDETSSHETQKKSDWFYIQVVAVGHVYIINEDDQRKVVMCVFFQMEYTKVMCVNM